MASFIIRLPSRTPCRESAFLDDRGKEGASRAHDTPPFTPTGGPVRQPGFTRRHLFSAVALVGAGCAPTGVLPSLALPGIDGLTRYGWPVPGIAADQFVGPVTVLNVWASWCPYCRGEHEILMRLSQDRRFSLVGLVYQDTAEKARDYLMHAGNPYRAVAVDGRGEFARALGQRGVPATYVIDRQGRIASRLRGALSDERVRSELMPAVAKALA
jgi:cytochrome c biogenesis protein CcmG/thiol:disulfide interchange protein DsbE